MAVSDALKVAGAGMFGRLNRDGKRMQIAIKYEMHDG